MLPEQGRWNWPLIEERYGPVPMDKKTEIDAISCMSPSHIWIECDGKAYDAEHPAGVASPFDLMFFRRYIENSRPGPAPT
jgi:hypothetical protein